MAGEDDNLVDCSGMLLFELHGASASHRIADEMAGLRNILFLEI